MKVDPDTAGFDPRRLERVTEHIERRYIEPGKLAGCQVAVARHGEVAYFRSFGRMDLERDRPVADDTIWRIYSMTKPITGVALMTLYEHGHFQLSDPVHRFIPEWRDMRVRERSADGSAREVEPERPITVRDLLMHMSGLRPTVVVGPDGTIAPARGCEWREGATLEILVERLAERPLAFHPGTRWLYGDSTDVCGRLVEVVSGQAFDDYLRTTIFEPLRMVDTGFVVHDGDVGRFAACYRRDSQKRLVLFDDPDRSRYREQPKLLSGGGGLVSTTADYLRFSQMLLNGGELDGVRVLGRKTVELMAMNHLPGGEELRRFVVPGSYGETGFDGVGFGLTMAMSLGPVMTQVVGSAGDFYWGGAASTIFWVDPAEALTVVFMTQLLPSGTFNFRGQLKTLLYPAIVD